MAKPDRELSGTCRMPAEVEYMERLVDNMCMQLVQKPELYDVIVLPNLYGDILSDLCAGLVGGLGVAPGANYRHRLRAIFEATHGSAPKYKGQNKVNPTALILSGKLMLEHLGEKDAAEKLENGRRRRDRRRQGRDLRHEDGPQRSDRRRHAANGRRDLQEDPHNVTSKPRECFPWVFEFGAE